MTSESKSTKYLAFGNSSHPVPRFLEPKRLYHKKTYMYSSSLAAFFVGSGLTSSSTHTRRPRAPMLVGRTTPSLDRLPR